MTYFSFFMDAVFIYLFIVLVLCPQVSLILFKKKNPQGAN